MYIYLLHFAQRHFHAGHYLGSTDDLDRRLTEHATHDGAKILCVESIDWELARLWQTKHYRTMEALLKRYAHSPKYCPICTESPRSLPISAVELSPLLIRKRKKSDYVHV